MDNLKKAIVGSVEKFFYWYGLVIANNPWKFLFGSLIFAGFSSFGLLMFRQEKNPIKLWIPQGSDFGRDTNLILDRFKEGYRTQHVLFLAPNVLEPQVLQEVEKIRKKVVSITVGDLHWEDVCFSFQFLEEMVLRPSRGLFYLLSGLISTLYAKSYYALTLPLFLNIQNMLDLKIPAVKRNSFNLLDIIGRKKRFLLSQNNSGDDSLGGLPFDPSLFLDTKTYCSIVNKLPKLCLEVNLPQLWSNDEHKLDSLTLNDVIYKLQVTKSSPIYGHNLDYSELLGGSERDEKGRIVSAKAVLSSWLTHVNYSMVNMDETGNTAGTGDWASGSTLIWENGFLELMKKEELEYKDTNLSIFYEAGRSYGDISSASMFQDVGKLFIGSIIMFLFVQLVLPKHYNWVEFRFGLGCVGLLSISLSFVVAVSLCSLMGIPYGPVHTSLPFLLLGIGVDDMFVIASCYKNLDAYEQRVTLEERIAIILSRAGVSITITSVTDLVAFLVGSFTILPSLQSFCIYTAIGILVMFFFQTTMVVSYLCLDEKRIAQKRNSVIFCIKHTDFRPNEEAEIPFEASVFDTVYRNFVFKTPVKILILLTTVVLTGFAINGNLKIKQRFDPKWFLPENSYLLQFFNQRHLYYPDMGMNGAVFIGQVNYSADFLKIHELAETFEKETEALKSIDYWTRSFIKYTRNSFGVDLLTQQLSDDKFHEYLSRFMWSPYGAKYQKNIKFERKLECGKPAPHIVISSFDFILRHFDGPEEHIPAMNRLKFLAKNSSITSGDGFVTVWSRIFANWVTDEVIDRELYRNLAMALSCVMFCSALLIVDLQICFWIFMSVFLTLVDVAGFIHYWGLFIDVATCIAMVLAVGLCVDFAAHIGHVFLTIEGSREERSIKTVKYIGTATFNGALSTFLAVSLLGSSNAYIFRTFFKIFFLVILFGIFHGILFLPVVLSLIGPKPYSHHVTLKRNQSIVMEQEILQKSEDTEMLKQAKQEDGNP